MARSPPVRQVLESGCAQQSIVADLNGDGKLDVVIPYYSAGGPAVLQGNGDGTFTSQVLYTGRNTASAAVADFNGDGMPDVASSTPAASTPTSLA